MWFHMALWFRIPHAKMEIYSIWDGKIINVNASGWKFIVGWVAEKIPTTRDMAKVSGPPSQLWTFSHLNTLWQFNIATEHGQRNGEFSLNKWWSFQLIGLSRKSYISEENLWISMVSGDSIFPFLSTHWSFSHFNISLLSSKPLFFSCRSSWPRERVGNQSICRDARHWRSASTRQSGSAEAGCLWMKTPGDASKTKGYLLTTPLSMGCCRNLNGILMKFKWDFHGI